MIKRGERNKDSRKDILIGKNSDRYLEREREKKRKRGGGGEDEKRKRFVCSF